LPSALAAPPASISIPTGSTTPAPSPSGIKGSSTTSASAATHAGTRVLLLVQDLHIRVINADTGELTLTPPSAIKPPESQSAQLLGYFS
jgi:hypothetical protein